MMSSKNLLATQPVVILVFRTDAAENLDQLLVFSLFRNEAGVKAWNFDFEDRDHIFRVESCGVSAEEIIEKLSSIGIEATELED